jgi:NAD(P)-dependent dehydrogenase (short-subunit alcohol dehydrogenase family)
VASDGRPSSCRARAARVVAEDLNPEVRELEDDQVAALRGDVAEPDIARRAVALAHERFGALHVLVTPRSRSTPVSRTRRRPACLTAQ